MSLVFPLPQAPVAFVGGAHVDRRARSGTPYVPAASNPGSLHQSAGGAALNAALAWRAVGGAASILSARGGDPDARLVEAATAAAEIEDLSVTWLDRTTASYTAILDDRGDLVAGVADMAIYDLLSPRVLARRHVREALAARPAVLLDANLPAGTIGHLTVGDERPTLVGAIGVSPAKCVRLRNFFEGIDALFLSRAEAAAIAHATAATRLPLLAELLLELGARRIVVTDGAAPAMVIADGAALLHAPLPVQPRDVTGAGDTLAGIAFGLHAGGLSFDEAARLGMAAATLRIRDGAFPDADALPEAVAAILDEMPPAEALTEIEP